MHGLARAGRSRLVGLTGAGLHVASLEEPTGTIFDIERTHTMIREVTATDRDAIDLIAETIERIYNGLLATDDFSPRSALLRDAFEKTRSRIGDISERYNINRIDQPKEDA